MLNPSEDHDGGRAAKKLTITSGSIRRGRRSGIKPRFGRPNIGLGDVPLEEEDEASSIDQEAITETTPIKVKTFAKEIKRKNKYKLDSQNDDKDKEKEDGGGEYNSFTEKVLKHIMDNGKKEDDGDAFSNYQQFGDMANHELTSFVEGLRRELEKLLIENHEKVQELQGLNLQCDLIENQNAVFAKQAKVWEELASEHSASMHPLADQDWYKVFPVGLQLKSTSERAEDYISDADSEDSDDSLLVPKHKVRVKQRGIGKNEEKTIQSQVSDFIRLKRKLAKIDMKLLLETWTGKVRNRIAEREQGKRRTHRQRELQIAEEIKETKEATERYQLQLLNTERQKDDAISAKEKLKSKALVTRHRNEAKINAREAVVSLKEEYLSLTPEERRQQVADQVEQRLMKKRQNELNADAKDGMTKNAVGNLKGYNNVVKAEDLNTAIEKLIAASGVSDLNDLIERVCTILAVGEQLRSHGDERESQVEILSQDVKDLMSTARDLRNNRTSQSLIKETDKLSDQIAWQEKRLTSASNKLHRSTQLLSSCRSGMELLQDLLQNISHSPGSAYPSPPKTGGDGSDVDTQREVRILRQIEAKQLKMIEFLKGQAEELQAEQNPDGPTTPGGGMHPMDPNYIPQSASSVRLHPLQNQPTPQLQASKSESYIHSRSPASSQQQLSPLRLNQAASFRNSSTALSPTSAHVHSMITRNYALMRGQTASTAVSTPMSVVNIDRIYLGGQVSSAEELSLADDGLTDHGDEEDEGDPFHSPSRHFSPATPEPHNMHGKNANVNTALLQDPKHRVTSRYSIKTRAVNMNSLLQGSSAEAKRTWWEEKAAQAKNRARRRRASVNILNPQNPGQESHLLGYGDFSP